MNEQKDPDPQSVETGTNTPSAQEHDVVRTQSEAVTSTYQPNMDTATGMAIGPNPVSHVTNNYGLTPADLSTIMEMLQKAPGMKSSPRTPQTEPDRVRMEYLRQNLEYEKHFIASENEVNTNTSGMDAKLPRSREEFVHWYKLLTAYEQCFVQATAVFHGAPFKDVMKLVDQLYQPVWEREKREQRRRQALSLNGQTADALEELQPELPPRPSRGELLARTHTIAQSVNRVVRLYWQGADRDEQYTFNLRALEFLAEETGFLVEADFGEQLTRWPEELSGECSWKAAHSLGVTLCCQNTDELWRLANKWGNSTRLRDWRLAASLLDGAYRFDYQVDPDRANNTRTSPVFRLLNQWAERAENPTHMNIRVGCAAAHTYSIIGKKMPDIALIGLDRLLRFPDNAIASDWELMPLDILLAGVADYVGLAWSGHIRKVLEHLARHVQELALQRHRPDDLTARPLYRFQQGVNLETVFEIFFLIAASTLPEEQALSEIAYNLADPLPVNPLLPDGEGRDILLAGILSTVETEQAWRTHITPILCAAIFYDNNDRAYWLLREWARIIAGLGQANAAELQTAYVQYLLHLHRTVKQWNNEMEKAGIGSLPITGKFKYKIGNWKHQRVSQTTDAIVDAVLAELASVSEAR